ncbi:MAG: lycopene cyclase domain-containing protein [Candidatus Nanopelagicaceae bacterium]|nr:lycopene cyclase domain-containing protein [Candidatus Nanopelagicaceae bacterium]
MTYTQIVFSALGLAMTMDLLIVRTELLRRKAFWTSYVIILPFQLLTNWWLTSREIVRYNPSDILGVRIAAAPIEDLIYGFALILGVLSLWVYYGRRQRMKTFAA